MQFGEEQAINPIQYYLEWKGWLDDGYFAYWDKEKEENVKLDFGKVIVLNVGYTIKGYDEIKTKKNKTFISYYSNEIRNFKEKFIVMKSDGDRFEWRYKNKTVGGQALPMKVKLHIAITALMPKENITIEFFLKGNNYYELSQILNKVNITQNKIEISEVIKHPESDIKYSSVLFKESDEITAKEKALAMVAVEEINKYELIRKKKWAENQEDEEKSLDEIVKPDETPIDQNQQGLTEQGTVNTIDNIGFNPNIGTTKSPLAEAVNNAGRTEEEEAKIREEIKKIGW